MNIFVNNQNIFRQTQQYIVNTRSREHVIRPTANLSYLQKVYTVLTSKSSTVYHQISEVIGKKPQFKVALKRFLIITPLTLLMNLEY